MILTLSALHRARSLATLCVLLVIQLLFPGTAHADAVVISGTIIDAKGAVSSAEVTPYLGTDKLTIPQRTDSKGHFQVVIPSFDADHVLIEVKADGYEDFRKQYDVNRPNIDVKDIHLTRSPALALSEVVVSKSAEQARLYLEFTLANVHKSQVVNVRALRINGVSPAPKTCIGGGAETVLSLTNLLAIGLTPGQKEATLPAQGTISIKSTVQGGAPDLLQVKAEGELMYRSCSVSNIRFDLPYLLPLKAGDRTKLRIELPLSIQLTGTQAVGRDGPKNLSWEPRMLMVEMEKRPPEELPLQSR